MLHANFNTYNNYVTDSLYQWDVNQGLVISGLNLSVAPEIHFANADMDRAIVRQATLESGVVTVRIPNSILQAALTIKAYVGIYESETFKVIETIEIPVIARTKPADYTIEDSDEEIYSFNKLENEIATAKKEVADRCAETLVEVATAVEKATENLENSVEETTEILNARVNNIIAHNNDTESNTELIDIRTGVDGTVYGSAGDAVRGQIGKLNDEVVNQDIRFYDKSSMMMAESRNLFDGYIIPNMVIQSSTGKEISHDSYRTTRFIEVEADTKYTLYGWLKCDFYDKNRAHITTQFTQSEGRVVITTPTNCKFARFGTEVTFFTQQIYIGEVDANSHTYSHLSFNPNYMPKSVVYAQNNTVNRFNGVVFENTGIDENTGNEKNLDYWRTSEYINVLPNAHYTAYRWMKVAFYKKDYTFHSFVWCQSEPTFQVPDGCYFIRLTTSLTSRKQMLVAGDRTNALYIPFKETISADMMESPIWKEKTYFYDKIIGYFNAPTQDAFDPSESERTVESIYEIYDGLMTAYPNYVTKTDLGLDQSDTYHIYSYNFKPELPSTTEFDTIENKHLPKIVICAGIHGLERWGVYAIAQLMKVICTNPNNDPVLEYLRNGIEFVIVPLVNPWGYANATQWNSRGVNICRNFEHGWRVSGYNAFTYEYEGVNSMSEAETRHITDLLNGNLDALAVIDVHTHDITEWDKTYWINGVRDAKCYGDVVSVARNTISRLTKSIKANYNQAFDGFAGYVEGIEARGSLQSQAVKYGLNAMVAECVDKLVGELESGTPLTNQVNVEFYANLIVNIIKYYQ